MLTFRTHLSLAIWDGGETEVDLIIKYQVSRGTPEVGAGYLADPAGYDPGSPDEIDIHEITLIRNSTELYVPKWLTAFIRNDEALLASLSEEAMEAA